MKEMQNASIAAGRHGTQEPRRRVQLKYRKWWWSRRWRCLEEVREGRKQKDADPDYDKSKEPGEKQRERKIQEWGGETSQRRSLRERLPLLSFGYCFGAYLNISASHLSVYLKQQVIYQFLHIISVLLFPLIILSPVKIIKDFFFFFIKIVRVIRQKGDKPLGPYKDKSL